MRWAQHETCAVLRIVCINLSDLDMFWNDQNICQRENCHCPSTDHASTLLPAFRMFGYLCIVVCPGTHQHTFAMQQLNHACFGPGVHVL